MGSPLARRWARLPNYVRALGGLRGLRMWIAIERRLGATSTQIKRHVLPSPAKGPVWLRATTSDHAVFWQVMIKRQYEFGHFPQARKVNDVLRRMLLRKQPPTIVDGGGNIGLAAVWFAQRFPGAHVVSVEPDAANFELLCRNVAPYGEAVRSIRGGLSNRSGRLVIENPQSGSAAFRVRAADGGEEGSVPALTVDELTQSQEILIVKLDIEGSQKGLFESNTDWVCRTHLIILELDDWQLPWQGTSRPFFATLSRYRFDYLLHGESIFCFQDLDSS